MPVSTTNMGLTTWTALDDYFSPTQLAENFQTLDLHDHTEGNGVPIEAGGLAANSVTGSALASGSVTESKLGSGSVTSSAVGASSIGTTQLASLPVSHVYNSATQNAVNGSVTALSFNTTSFDVGTMHNPGSQPTRLVAPVTGVYLISTRTIWNSSASGTWRSNSIRLNGSTILKTNYLNPADTTADEHDVTLLYKLTAGAYVQSVVEHDAAGTLTISASSTFAAAWVSKG